MLPPSELRLGLIPDLSATLVAASVVVVVAGGALFGPGSGGDVADPRVAIEAPIPASPGPPRSPVALDPAERQAEAVRGLSTVLVVLGTLGAGMVTFAGAAVELGRGSRRVQGLAVRAGLGAAPSRLVVQRVRGRGIPLVAGILFGTAGGGGLAMGLFATWPGRRSPAPPSLASFAAAFVITLILLFVILEPARSAYRRLPERLRIGGSTADPWEGRGREVLFVLQIAVALGVLSGSTGLFRTVVTSPGPASGAAEPVWIIELETRAEAPAAAQARLEALVQRAASPTTVGLVSISSPGAWTGLGRLDGALAECGACPAGGVPVPFRRSSVTQHVVSPAFFDQAGLILREGRLFRATDEVVVNASYARDAFDRRGPVGRSIRVGRGGWNTIVGVVDDLDVTAVGRRPGEPYAVYFSTEAYPPHRVDLALTTPEPPLLDALLGGSGYTVRAEPAGLAAVRAQAARPLAWFALLGGAIGILSLAASLAGVTSVASLQVRARVREIGVRAALGAGPGALRRWVLRRSTVVGTFGIGLAIPLAIGVRGLLEPFGGKEGLLDLPSFLAFAVVLLAGCLTSAAAPARWATRVDPAIALRSQ
jgi:hypothetical protein